MEQAGSLFYMIDPRCSLATRTRQPPQLRDHRQARGLGAVDHADDERRRRRAVAALVRHDRAAVDRLADDHARAGLRRRSCYAGGDQHSHRGGQPAQHHP